MIPAPVPVFATVLIHVSNIIIPFLGISPDFLHLRSVFFSILSIFVSKIFSIWICIVMFISSGFEHIVVNQLLCPLGMMIGAGEYGDVTIGQMFANNLIPVTIGNFIGALVLSLIMYGCYHRDLPENLDKEIAAKESASGTNTPEVVVSLGSDGKM